MEIRQAKMADLDAIVEIESCCFPIEQAASKHTFEKRLEAFGDSFLIAEENGVSVGFINGCVTDEKVIRDEMFADVSRHKSDGAYQAVFGLAVLPSRRGKGIAKELLTKLIDSTKAKGKKGLILTCQEQLIGFYGALGFKSLGISNSTHGGAVWYDMILEF